MKRLLFIFILGLLLNTAWSQNNTYEVVMSHSGVENLYTGSDLDKPAGELQTLLQQNGVQNFKVLGADFYPILAYVNPQHGFEQTFENLISTQDGVHPTYCLIAKEHLPGGALNYRVHIRFPATGPFGQLSPFEQEGVRGLFVEAINAEAAKNNNLSATSAEVEAAGLNALKDLFQQIIDGTLDLGMDLMAKAGFEGIDVEPGQYFERPQQSPPGSPQAYGANSVRDYTGLQVGDTPADLRAYSSEVSVTFPDSLSFLNILNHAYIITDEENTISELLNAEEAFKEADEKIIVWMHFNNVDAQGFIDKVNIKYSDNVSLAEAEQIIDSLFLYRMSKWMPEIDFENNPVAFKEKKEELLRSAEDCKFGFKYGKRCLLERVSSEANVANFGKGVAIGLFDGLLGTLEGFYEAGKGIKDVAKSGWRWLKKYTQDLIQHAIEKQSLLAVFGKVSGDAKKALKDAWDNVVEVYGAFKKFIETEFDSIIESIKMAAAQWIGNFAKGDKGTGYTVGVLAFELILTALTGGAAGAGVISKVTRFLEKLTPQNASATIQKLLGQVTQASSKPTKEGKELARKVTLCKMLGGCFVKDTPVYILDRTHFSKTAKGIILASLPIITIPIQDVQLLDYVQSCNIIPPIYKSTVDLDENQIFQNASLRKDIYTSDQQIERDNYDLEAGEWYEVTFENINRNSLCKLALNKSWIDSQGEYRLGSIVSLNIPEQNVYGYSQITSIKHILPQKKPEYESEKDDFVFRPVTGVFIYESNQVWDLSFTNGDTLGVTYNHPIYSVTSNNWKQAGTLEIGEKVLTKKGSTELVSKKWRPGIHKVYNLEVKELHNFLVGNEGIVVHNGCNWFDHIFKGKIEIIGGDGLPGGIPFKFKVSGIHHKNAINGSTARIKAGTKTTPNAKGYYKAKVEMHHDQNPNNGGWKTKKNESTFFPDSWDESKVTDEISKAFVSSKKKLIAGRKYESELTDGTKIIFFVDEKDRILTAYPLID